MRTSKTTPGERIVKDIKRKIRKQYSADEMICIVLDGLRDTETRGGSTCCRGTMLRKVKRLLSN